MGTSPAFPRAKLWRQNSLCKSLQSLQRFGNQQNIIIDTQRKKDRCLKHQPLSINSNIISSTSVLMTFCPHPGPRSSGRSFTLHKPVKILNISSIFPHYRLFSAPNSQYFQLRIPENFNFKAVFPFSLPLLHLSALSPHRGPRPAISCHIRADDAGLSTILFIAFSILFASQDK